MAASCAPGRTAPTGSASRSATFPENPEAIALRLRDIERGGVPNYFGPQRFGRDGANLRVARVGEGGSPPRERAARSFALSAARSRLFNAVLARRVQDRSWDRLLPGDAAMLDGRRSWFRVTDVDETLQARCRALDLHPSGPLHGRGELPVTGPRRRSSSRSRSRKPRSAGCSNPSGSNTNDAACASPSAR